MKKVYWIYFIPVLLASIIAWSPSYQAPYLFDDYVVPVSDPASKSMIQWARNAGETLRPITKLSFAVESDLGLTSASLRRIFNYFIFLLSGLLVLAILSSLQESSLMALLGAAIFLLHPLNADNFILLAGRSALLGQCFLLASLFFNLKRKNGLSILMAFLAICSRETTLLAALLLIALSLIRLFRDRKSLSPVLAIAIAIIAFVPFYNSHFRSLMEYSLTQVGSADHLGLQVAGLSRGLAWIVAPLGLSIDHDFAVQGLARLALILTSFVIVSLSFFYYYKSRSVAALTLLLGILIILPTQSIIGKLDALTERPFGTALPFVVLGAALSIPKMTAGKLGAIGLVITVALGLITWQRAAIFKDEISVWQEAADLSIGATRQLSNLGTLFVQKRQYSKGLTCLKTALARNPIDINLQQKIDAAIILQQTDKEIQP